MINTVTPWTATVQSDIHNSEPLYEISRQNYAFRILNAGDSLWLTVQWPSSGSIAFRLAFGMNSVFEHTAINKFDEGILITAATRLGSYRIVLSFPETNELVLRYTTTFRLNFPLLIPFWPRDIVPLTKDGRIENTAGIVHTHQIGSRSGQIFFSMTKPQNGTVLYFQNLSAMSEYCDVSETTVADSVGGQWPEIGFQFPINKEKAIPADREFIISDAFVLFSDTIPEEANQVTQKYLDYLAVIYTLLPKPETCYTHWPDVADKALADLNDSKGCWLQTEGIPYLNAYVCDYKTPPEVMVQLAVLLSLTEYLKWKGEKNTIFADLINGLPYFYDENIKSIVRWHPSLKDNLDNSEEQKQDMVMDSWYLHHPLLNLSRLAEMEEPTAKKLFLDSIDYAIKVAHHFDYEWPVFYKMTTLEVIKAETSPGKGGENDVAGSYAHVMLMAWKLTKEKRFLSEAVKAIKSLDGLGLDIFYQANNTAFAAGALLELYMETKEERYLDLSYSCMAGIFKNVQLWERNYGYGKEFPSFFSVFPLNDAPYTAAYEELEVYAALHQYLLLADTIDILPSLKILIPECIKYAVSRLAYYYPSMLSQEMVSEEVKTGEIKRDLWIPLEDIHDGWEKSGQVGQEVYGAGLPFGIIPRQYILLRELNAWVFVDYPTGHFRHGKRSLSFHVLGDDGFKASLRLIGIPTKAAAAIKVESKSRATYQQLTPVKKKEQEFEIRGNSIIRISW